MYFDDMDKRGTLSGLMVKATHIYFSKVYQQMADSKVHPGQLPMFKILERNPGLSQREIANQLHIKPPTVTVTLKRMEKLGFIEKRADEKDQRVMRIYLSDKGRKAGESLGELIRDDEVIMCEGFTESELHLFKRFLRQFMENTEKIPIDITDEQKRNCLHFHHE
jgi:DNA-binding MarR family transcriptional regulator